MKRYKTIRNGTLALIAILMVFCSLFPIVLAQSGTAIFQESTADIGDTIHAEFTWTDAQWNTAGEFFCDMSIKDPDGNNHDYYIEEDDSSGHIFLSAVTDAIGIWEAQLKVWDGSAFLTYSATVYVGSAGTASGSASFQEASAETGDTIHADFAWSHAHYHLVGECYATMYIYKPDDSTAASYIEESVASGSRTLSYTTDAIGIWEAEIKVYDGSSWLTYTDTLSVSGAGNDDPVAVIERSEPVGLSVDFDASSSYDLDGTITTYQWDFTNDGSWDYVGMTVSYTYPSAGPYTCKLRVIDNDGAWGDDTDSFTLSGGGANEDPVASFTYSTNGLTVFVDGFGSSDSDGTITGYQWDWTTDGSYDTTGETQSHTYSANGTYNVTLRVMDNGSATNTTMHQVTVTTGGSSSSGFVADDTMTYLIIGVVAAIAIGAVIYFGPTMKKGGRKKK